MIEEKAVLAFVKLVHKKKKQHITPHDLRRELGLRSQHMSDILNGLTRKGVLEKVDVVWSERNPGEEEQGQVVNGVSGHCFWYRPIDGRKPRAPYIRVRSIGNLGHMYPRIQKELYKYHGQDRGDFKKGAAPPEVVCTVPLMGDSPYSITFYDKHMTAAVAFFLAIGKANRYLEKEDRKGLLRILNKAIKIDNKGKIPDDLKNIGSFIEAKLKEINWALIMGPGSSPSNSR